MQRALDGAPGMDAEAFPLEERILKDVDMDFRAVYAGITKGAKLKFLKNWFCGVWEPMSIVKQEAGTASEDSKIQDLIGQDASGSDQNYDPFGASQKVWEWTAYDSDAEREEVWRRL